MNHEKNIYEACKDEPSLVFSYMKHEEYDLVEELLDRNIVNINTVDSVGNDVLMRLLKARQYDLLIRFMKKRNWNVNHQNEEGNTFGHILASDNSVGAVKVVNQLVQKSNYLPNMKNHKGETALDLALNNDYICTAFKILEDKRFNNIDISSFKNLLNVTIRNTFYGTYSKITNLEIIVENMEKKDLAPKMKDLVNHIQNQMDEIKEDIMNHHYGLLESIINSHLVMDY